MAYEAELDFYKQLDKLEKEREAAFAVRTKDPARWQKAKHQYAEFRTAMRVYSGRTTSGEANLNVQPQTAGVNVAAKNVGG